MPTDTSTPFYTFPGTVRTFDVRTITAIQPAGGDESAVVISVGSAAYCVEVDEPAAVCAEVSALMREHFQRPADASAQARIIGDAIADAVTRALSVNSLHGWTFGQEMSAKFTSGLDKMAAAIRKSAT